MMRAAILFILAMTAAMFGFDSTVDNTAASLAQIVFVVLLVAFCVALVFMKPRDER